MSNEENKWVSVSFKCRVDDHWSYQKGGMDGFVDFLLWDVIQCEVDCSDIREISIVESINGKPNTAFWNKLYGAADKCEIVGDGNAERWRKREE